MQNASRGPQQSAPERRAVVLVALALIVWLSSAQRALAVDPAVVAVERGGPVLTLSTTAAQARVHLRRYRMRLRDLTTGRTAVRERRTEGLFYERGGSEFGLGSVTDVAVLPDGVRLHVETDEGLEGVAATVVLRFLTPRTLDVVFTPPMPATVDAAGNRIHSPATEAIYGLTERLRDSPALAPPSIEIPIDDIQPPEVGSLDRRGETVEMRILPTFSLYAPFYQTSRGYGLAVAGTTFGLFDLASTDPQTIALRFELGSTLESQRLRYHIFLGPEHVTILDEYTKLTGRPIVPPDWAFLHWRWRNELVPGPPALLDGVPVNAQVADDINMYDVLDIPPGVYLFDRPVLVGNFGFAHWEWDEVRLPNVDAMLASITQRGYRLATWSSTWMCGTGPGDNGTEAQARGYLAPSAPGPTRCSNVGGNFILDVTNPAARDWWRDEVAAFMARYGIQGIKLDRGEEHIPSGAGDIWFDGRTGQEVRNAYPSLQAEIHHDALRSVYPSGDFVLLSRPGYTGTQRHSVFWGGDIPGSEFFGAGPGTDLGLRSAIISQQRAAFMGFPIWGSDTGGYYEFKDREVFARWIEFSTFSGIMEIGGTGTHAPWDMPTAPSFDQEMIDIYKRYTKLRETLLPYIVAAAQEAANGIPIVRPMPFFDRTDPELRDLWDQYMFGPDLMVAPVWRIGQRSRTIYVPQGAWRSYWDASQVFEGRKRVTVAVPLDTIPVFVREGATVPGP